AVRGVAERAAAAPLGQLGERGDVLLAGPVRAGVAHAEGHDGLGVHEVRLQRPEHVQRRPLVEVTQHDRLLPALGRGLDEREQLVPAGRRLEAERVELRCRVVDAAHLARLGQAVERALAEGDAVARVAHLAQHAGGEAVVPSVCLGVAAEVGEQAVGHEGAHVAAGVVDLQHVRHVVAGQRQAGLLLEVVEGLRAAVDGDVRVLALEGVDQRLDRVVLRAAHLLVPHREGDVAGGVDVGVVLVGGGGGRLAGILRAGGAGGQEAEAAQRSSGAEEIPSSHHVLLRWAAPPAPARARSLPATAAGRSPMISPGRCYRDGAMKLTILGGGGFRVPLVYEAVATAATGLTVDEVALHDVDPVRLRTITAVIEGLAERLRAEGHGATLPRLTATADLREAVTGADFVFSAVRVGGAEARTVDERVALGLGLLGQETIGPGGLAYALRTLPD